MNQLDLFSLVLLLAFCLSCRSSPEEIQDPPSTERAIGREYSLTIERSCDSQSDLDKAIDAYQEREMLFSDSSDDVAQGL